MSTFERLSRLTALLDRVRKHARGPRVAAKAPTEQPRTPPAAAPRSTPPTLELVPEPPSTPEVQPFAPPDLTHSPLEIVETAPLESLGEEDVLEMSSDVLDSVPPSLTSQEPFEDEAPPASSGRQRRADTMEEALAAVECEPVLLEEGREVPLKTPPPESGPQEAPLIGLGAPPAPDIDQLLEDLPPVTGMSPHLPTAEQLGQTVDLDAPMGPELELAHPAATPPPESLIEELEITLPGRGSAGRYDDALMPPPEARDDLAAHRQRAELGSIPADYKSQPFTPTPAPLAYVEAPEYPEPPPYVEPEEPTVARAEAFGVREAELAAGADEERMMAAEAASLEVTETVERPALGTVSPIEIRVARMERPTTFLELLDGSLRLGT